LELDENAAVISYEEYYPYGSTSYQTGRSSAEVSLKRYRYTGKERDEESGLYYHGARYYAPWLGRWVSMDLAGPVDGPNLNAFVHNNPIRWIDPRGHQGVPSRYEPTEKAENFGLTIHFDETTGKVENPRLNLNPLFMPSPANDPEEEWLPLGTTGLKYRKTVEVLDIERPKPERSFWNRGGATLVGGLIALGVGALILASNPVGWALLLAGGFSLTAGIAGTGAGLAHLAASYSGQIPAEADAVISRAESDAMLLSGSATGLVVGATTLGLSGNIEKMRLGAFVGGVAESASTALYSSYRLVSRAADPQAVGNLGRLVHLTEGEAGAAINESGMLVGRRGIYVGPLANAEASGAKVTLRTGLSPRNYTTAVPIPANATGAFARPIPMGPLTGLQGRAGTAFTPYGSLNLSSGIFTATGANLRQLIFPLVDLGFMSVERLMLHSSPWIQEQ
jgi:RHS repeat-associated protein